MKPYCANCGKRLTIIRKALPNYNVIVDLIVYHECPQNFDLSDSIAEAISGKDKFVQSLNELPSPSIKPSEVVKGDRPKSFPMTGTDDLRDRRFDTHDKQISTAPSTVVDQIKSMSNSIPANTLEDTTDSEMGG